MIQRQDIPSGYTFQLSADGAELVCGYQTCKHVNMLTGVETPWLLNGSGEWYPCGWDLFPCPYVFQPTAVNPPQTQAYRWDVEIGAHQPVGKDTDAVGTAGLAVIDGLRLSTNGQQIFLDGVDITPESFNGPVWDDVHHYAYKRRADGGGPFVVRRISDNGIATEIDAQGMWERCYTIAGLPWVTGQYPGGSRVYKPGADTMLLPVHELAGPVLERDSLAYVATAVMGAQNNPRGVMVRPWSELVSGGLKGWWCDGVRHQCLQMRVTPAGDIIVGGCEFPGSGLITLATIPKNEPMRLVPPESIEPPIDPPPIDPEDPMDPVLLAKLNAMHDDIKEAKAASVVAASQAAEANAAANAAALSAQNAATAASLAVVRVTDAPVKMPYLGTGRLNPK